MRALWRPAGPNIPTRRVSEGFCLPSLTRRVGMITLAGRLAGSGEKSATTALARFQKAVIVRHPIFTVRCLAQGDYHVRRVFHAMFRPAAARTGAALDGGAGVQQG